MPVLKFIELDSTPIGLSNILKRNIAPFKTESSSKTTYEDIEIILNVIVDSLNKILYSLCETTYAFNDNYKRDYKYILECIKEYRENQLSKYRKQD